MASRIPTPAAAANGVCLPAPAQLAAFLASFCRYLLGSSGARMEATEGLWKLFQWCWRLDAGARSRSALCACLLAGPGRSWLDEADVVEALARRQTGADPSRFDADALQRLIGAFVAEGERVRGRSPGLDLHLEFALPRISGHPTLSADAIAEALRASGAREELIREHLAAREPERQPYLGAWILSLRATGGPESSRASERGVQGELRLAFEDARVGRRSLLAASLRHEPDFAGYFHLSVAVALARHESAAAEPP